MHDSDNEMENEADKSGDGMETPDPDAVIEDDAEEVEEAGARRSDPYAVLSYQDGEDEKPIDNAERLKLGERQMAHGFITDALNTYREAVRASDNEDSATENRTMLGDAYAYSGQAVNAFRQYRRAIKTSPRKAEPHFSLAELYQRYGRLQAAIREYRKAVSFAPTNAYYRYKLGDALALAGDMEGAVAISLGGVLSHSG
jgi:Tfp pilus assembly protein PilF